MEFHLPGLERSEIRVGNEIRLGTDARGTAWSMKQLGFMRWGWVVARGNHGRSGERRTRSGAYEEMMAAAAALNREAAARGE